MPESNSAPGAKVYFEGLKDGETVKSSLKVVFGVEGMEIAPAETEKPNSGHHHLLLDRPAFDAAEADAGIGKDANNIHFGKGQTETTLELAPGKHTLQLLLGDLNHIPHNPPVVSDVVTITVE